MNIYPHTFMSVADLSDGDLLRLSALAVQLRREGSMTLQMSDGRTLKAYCTSDGTLADYAPVIEVGQLPLTIEVP